MYKNSLRKVIIPLALAAAIAIGVLLGQYISQNRTLAQLSALKNIYTPDNKLSAALSLIEKVYIDTLDMDSIAEKLLPELVKELDPHSVYIPQQDMAGANEALDGEFDGIGVVFNMVTDTVTVLNVIPSGPSDKAGVKAGDRIIKINDTVVAGKKIDQNKIVKKLRGKRGTQVNVGIERTGIKGLVPISITRGAIPIKSLDAAFMIKPGVGFIKLSAFSRTSYDEVRMALDKLRSEGMKRLVFDLRGNGGGFLDQAISIANEFLGRDKLIVYTVDRFGKKVHESANGRGSYTDLPVVILIDEGSASSSEILAGALQDNDRGTIIGRRSFGKGLVQQQFPFSDGSALRLTIARYYTPTGRSIQKPYNKGGDAYYEEILTRFNHSEFFRADSIKFADSLKFKTAGGKTVYGGGGIMPDIFVALDTTDMTKYFIEVAGKNLILKFAMNYADKNRKAIEGVKTLAQLEKLLDGDKNLLNSFIAYAAANGVAPNPKQIAISRKILDTNIKATIARNSPMEDNGMYMFLTRIDNTLQQAQKE